MTINMHVVVDTHKTLGKQSQLSLMFKHKRTFSCVLYDVLIFVGLLDCWSSFKKQT